MHDFAVRVATRGGKMSLEPLYAEGHPKRIEKDQQRNNIIARSPSKKKNKNKNYRTMHSSSESEVEKSSKNSNDVSISDAETQSGNEHPPSDNDNVHVDAQPFNGKESDNDVEIEPIVDLDNPPPKNKRYGKIDFIARKHGKEREP